jgi:hypothetical protein
VYTDTTMQSPVSFNPRGVWSSVATYQKNDLASKDNSSYIAINPNTNSSPPSVDWMLSAHEGVIGPTGGVGIFFDKGTGTAGSTQVLDYGLGQMQRLQVGGALTIGTTGWPSAAGGLGEMLIELVNGGSAVVTWPVIQWILGDGTVTTNFALNGVVLQSTGTDWALLWTRDGGATVYGRFMR